MVAGPSGNYKSFLAIDWTMSMACGRKWNGRPTVPSRVLYVLGEGKSNLLKRLQAWMGFNGVSPAERSLLDANFRVSFEVPQLASSQSVTDMLSRLSGEGFEPSVIVVDTFARSFVGKDENDALDTGLWIEQADRLRQMGYTVIFLHHTVKNTAPEFGGVRYRGSTAIMGAMDTSFNLYKDKDDKTVSVLQCTKQKDHEDDFELYFRRMVVQPTNDHKDDSLVLLPIVKPVKMDERFSKNNDQEEEKIKMIIANLLSNQTYDSDRARGQALAHQTGLGEDAAQSRISRARRKSGEALG